MPSAAEKATQAIVQASNEWLVRLQDPASGVQDATQFTHWLHHSPVHVREYLRAESNWVDLGNIDPDRRMDIDALLGAEDSNVMSLKSGDRDKSGSDRPASFSTRSTRLWASIAAVAASLTLIIGANWYLTQTDSSEYETGRGEQRRLVLSDGSIIDMNTQTQIKVRLSAAERYIDFVQGEALFTVAKDPDRPFVVESDLVVVRALGTQFNVYHRPDQVLVTVLEGRVAVENALSESPSTETLSKQHGTSDRSIELLAGDQAEVVAEAAIRTAPANTERTLAWRERRLIFEDQTLAQVVAEFNRYNKRQLIIHDHDLSMKRISAVFDVDQPDALIRFLAQSTPIETISTSASELVILIRK